MTRTDDLYALPADLPEPEDDGGCDHLPNAALPPLALRATSGDAIDLSAQSGRSVVYAYPRTGVPSQNPVAGWNSIPGARGCTPESCAFRDHHAELTDLGARVFGLSTQSTNYQREAVDRLHLPFHLLSDDTFELTDAMTLPTFIVDRVRLLKRFTMIICDGRIEHVFYPVFPPNQHAAEVVEWLTSIGASR